MLYQPEHFKTSERAFVHEVIRAHPLATILSLRDGELDLSHAPLLIAERGDGIVLLGHVARANAHWQHWQASAAANGKPARVTAIFHGPDAYVSPSWYLNPQSVPTWNYLVVHAHGTVAIRHDSADKEEILKALIDTHDPPYRAHWSEVLSEEFRERQKAAIVGLEIAVDRIEAKFKLSQNRPAADRERVLSALAAGKSNDRAVADWMKRIAQSAA